MTTAQQQNKFNTLNCKIGVEIEGFIPCIKRDKLKAYCKKKKIKLDSDGSVDYRFYRTINPLDYQQPVKWENKTAHPDDTMRIELNGMGLVFDIKDLNKFYRTINKLFSFGIVVNSSCGLHLHISFNDTKNYFKLFSWDFINQFQNSLNEVLLSDYEKTRFISYYCKPYLTEKEFQNMTDKQVLDFYKSGARYYSINFNSFNIHKTIEFRVFASTNQIKTFKRYVNFWLNNIHDYLKNNPYNIHITRKATNTEEKPFIIYCKKDNTTAQQPNNLNQNNPELI